MEVRVKVRFNASKERFETYGGGKYLIYLPFEEDTEAERIIATILSRKLGTSPNRILHSGKDVNGDWVFQLT
jgi:hypothetical protein